MARSSSVEDEEHDVADELDREAADDPPSPAALSPRPPVVLRSFAVVFVAEFGDLTQLATASLAARTGQPFAVLLGAAVASRAVAGIVVIAGLACPCSASCRWCGCGASRPSSSPAWPSSRSSRARRPKYVGSMADDIPTLVFGGGGHGKQVIAMLRAGDRYEPKAVIDSVLPPGSKVAGVKVLGDEEYLAYAVRPGHPHGGQRGRRRHRHRRSVRVYEVLRDAGFTQPNIVHPAAYCENTAESSGVATSSPSRTWARAAGSAKGSSTPTR